MGSRIRLRTPLLAVVLLATAWAPAFAQTFSGLMSGSWWDASRAGEGQFVTFESAGARNVAYLAYFTYTAGGTATWHVGSADYAPGTTRIDIPLVTGAGPRFGAGYAPADFATAGAGTATLEFVACNRMRMRHSAMAGVTLELTRLVGPLGGADCAAPAPVAPAAAFAGPMSGHWWNAARAGEGQFVTFETVGGRNVAYLAYFTYTAEGRASWLVGSADHPAGATSITIPLVTGAGPSFGAGFRPSDFVPATGGSARLDFLSCSAMRLTYSGTQSFAFDLSRLVGPLTGHACIDAVPARLVSGPSPFPASCGAGSGVAYVNAEVEPSLAVNPSNPGHLVAIWQQDRWSNGSARGLVAAVSFDGGTTWATRPMAFSRCGGGNAANGGDFDRATDPWVSIGPDGTVWAMSLSTTGGSFAPGSANAMLVSRSADGGLTWGPAVPLIADTTPYFNDKNTITADPADARYAYAVWDRLLNTGGGPAMLARTTDGGTTWEPARAIFDPGTASQTIGNVIVTPSPGALVNVGLRIDYAADGSGRSASVFALRSEDRGLSWSAPVRIAGHLGLGARDPETGAAIRDGAIIPAAAAGPGGTLHVAWQDSRFSSGLRDAIAYSRSLDGGLTWSEPVRVNPDPAVAAFTPAVHVLADGTIGVTYFDLRDNTPDARTLPAGYWLARSADGVTWTETRLAGPFDLASAPNANGLFLGDYMGLAGSGTDFLSLFVRTTGDPANRTDVFLARAVTAAKDTPEGGAQARRWTALPAAPFEVDAGWAARIDEAIGRALAARGRVPAPR
ncbi:MAG: glycoside hydrolase [Lysobacter sp.]|nr:glycoside hydrolase [Lysobacter sp.]